MIKVFLVVNGNITCTGTMTVRNLVISEHVDMPHNVDGDIELHQYFNQIDELFDNVINQVV
jgi:hypothetical protein